MGEASNPGPKGKKRRRRVTSSPDPTDSDLSAFLDGFEQDLCPVVSNGVGTQVFPTSVEESCKPTQLQIDDVFDMSVDDSCDEEVLGGLHQASRRRLVLVSTKLESTRPTVEDTDGLQVDAHVDGSDTESVVGSQREDAQSTSEVNSEDGGLDLRIGAVQARQISEGVESMDQVVLGDILKIRGSVMKSVPKFTRGPFMMACRVAFDHHAISLARRDTLGQVRAWKLFLMLPRMLLGRPPRGGQVPKKKLHDRFAAFSRGERAQLVEASLELSHLKAQSATRRRRREQKDELSRGADRALGLVQLGELSAGRQALEGARLAPGTEETLQVLRDPEKRPPVPRERLSEAVREVRPERFEFDEELFLQFCEIVQERGGRRPFRHDNRSFAIHS